MTCGARLVVSFGSWDASEARFWDARFEACWPYIWGKDGQNAQLAEPKHEDAERGQDLSYVKFGHSGAGE
jgi:hypothetical protein